ncbi:MAG: hypothetical protein A2749_00185 [Parcubacteria group bacterium RIFCSPHIGHO2_01_FULL_45_26]|nr:MAG: hypothetical protein A2749_00185 [Parcubacteria group bacterium RIFCSPHIGHO2_01_FULL_45_26]
MADFKKDDKKPKPKSSSPWGMIIIVLLVSSALGKLGFGGTGNNATSTAKTASSTIPLNNPSIILGQ